MVSLCFEPMLVRSGIQPGLGLFGLEVSLVVNLIRKEMDNGWPSVFEMVRYRPDWSDSMTTLVDHMRCIGLESLVSFDQFVIEHHM